MTQATIATYIIARLKQVGLRHAFGVPGDYVLTFMDRLIEGGIELNGICNELNYAADAYAGRDHYVGHDFLGGCGHWDVPYAFGERLSWAPGPEHGRLAAFYDHRESTSSAAV